MRLASKYAGLLLTLLTIRPCHGYSVLSHEAVVDALWDVELKPVLLARYPNATPQELKEAHGYAYGGAILCDLGYYPRGNKHFSDLTHYARTGDFVLALISEAQNLDEFAFALGALSHHMADDDGHRLATNPAEAILYPKLRRKYGDVITYEQDPVAHVMTEFGFDVLEVAQGNYAPEAYHDFIGFYVSKTVLERAFYDTYGLNLNTMFPDFDRTVGSFRRAVSKTIPKATRIAWAQRKDEIQRLEPGITRDRFVYIMRRSSYERNWGKQYDRPTAGEQILAVVLRILPPIGPLRALRFKMPTPEVEKLFMQSFDRSADAYRTALEKASDNSLTLRNTNYDVGVVTKAGEYGLDDKIHAYWLHELAKTNFRSASEPIRGEFLRYYADLGGAPIGMKKDRQEWARVVSELNAFKGASLSGTVAGKTAPVGSPGQSRKVPF